MLLLDFFCFHLVKPLMPILVLLSTLFIMEKLKSSLNGFSAIDRNCSMFVLFV